MIVYDEKNKRLAVFEKQATPEFWDKHWQQDDLKKAVCSKQVYHFLKPVTTRYIRPGGKILEGGCGIGHTVFNLQSWGYDAYGVDFAKQTIDAVKKVVPSLNLCVQNVRHLEFPDTIFDGYWSLGVIEHFYDGYQEIAKEMARVIKPNGYLFLTFPVMSPLRKWKASLGLYQKQTTSMDLNTFYEFMLDPLRVKQDFEHFGFTLVQSHPYDALKGLKDEVPLFRPLLQSVYNGKGMVARGFRFVATLLLAKLTGHMMLFVFKKQ